MFLANSLKEKLKRNFLEGDPDAFDKAKFAYVSPPKDPRHLLEFNPPNQSPLDKLTTQKLQALDKKEWEAKFTLNKLRKDWNRQPELDFEPKHKKFPDEVIFPQVATSKKYVKNLIDPDILELKQKSWNISSDANTKLRPELKKTLFEVGHGLKDFKIVPLKDKNVEQGVDTRDYRMINGGLWNISTLIEDKEKTEANAKLKEGDSENTIKYWKDNEYNRFNEEPFPISEERKKIEVIRYFKKYRTPYQKTTDLYKTMEKVKNLTAMERGEVEKSVRYRNPGARYDEKINAIVHKEMYDSYKDKYNELTGKLDKEEMKKRQRRENKFVWNDSDLAQKILAVSSIENKEWFKPEYVASANKGRLSEEKIKKELLKPLVSNGNDIHIEEDRIKEKMEEDFKKQQKREILLKMKSFPKKREEKFVSRYPISIEKYEEMMKQREEEDRNGKKKRVVKSQTVNNIGNGMNWEDEEAIFLQAYQRVATMQCDRMNKQFVKNKDNVEFEYKHPGAYREFESKKEGKPEGKVKFWSCCMNTDENSKGCQKRIIKKFKWLYDP